MPSSETEYADGWRAAQAAALKVCEDLRDASPEACHASIKRLVPEDIDSGVLESVADLRRACRVFALHHYLAPSMVSGYEREWAEGRNAEAIAVSSEVVELALRAEDLLTEQTFALKTQPSRPRHMPTSRWGWQRRNGR